MAKRRTRAQKIATAKRRATQWLPTYEAGPVKESTPATRPLGFVNGFVKRQIEASPSLGKIQFPQAKQPEKTTTKLYFYNRVYLKRDLTKTAILATLALGLELVLYFGLEKGRLNLPF